MLAIDGGVADSDFTWPTWPPPATPEQRSMLATVLDSGDWGSTSGPLCGKLGEQFAAAHGAAHGVTLTNGTLALTVALRAAGVRAGDEVIVPAYTFVACATAVLLLGATPVIADVDARHLHLSAATVSEAITPRTRAIMAVHLAGSPAPMTEILDVAGDIPVIEDAAQAHGAQYRGTPVGGLGTAATFSFQSSKAMTAGEGGLVTTNDAAIADLVWSLCNVGRERSGAWYHHARIGWNLRMTEFQAALLLPWLDRLDAEIERRNSFADAMDEALVAGGAPVAIVPDPAGTTRNTRHLLMLRIDLPDSARPDREWIALAMAAEGVPLDLGYPGLGRIPAIVGDSRVLPSPGTDAAESVVWMRQQLLMGEPDAAWAAARAFERVLSDARSRRRA
jgi:dTDP-4-amino-4,6-dideoxygalactose transaminase